MLLKDIKHVFREKIEALTNYLYVKNPHLGDWLGLVLIGLWSLGYIILLKSFAEFHLKIPFLNFPIFVGEILLFFCLILFFLKCRCYPPKLTKWHYLIICYFIFVVLKAFSGYLKWGPLALRHAALLYYPVFVVLGYTFYRREFLTGKINFFLFLIIIFTFLSNHYYEYYSATLFAFGLILIASYPKKIIKILLLLLLCICVPYSKFFFTSRMMILANLLSGLYLAGVFPVILKVRKEFKLGLTLLIAGIVILGLWKFAPHAALKSIVNFERMAKVFNVNDAQIQTKIKDFKMKEKKVGLYNPDKKASTPAPTATVPQQEKVIDEEAEKMKAQVREAILEQVKEKINEFSFETVGGSPAEEPKATEEVATADGVEVTALGTVSATVQEAGESLQTVAIEIVPVVDPLKEEAAVAEIPKEGEEPLEATTGTGAEVESVIEEPREVVVEDLKEEKESAIAQGEELKKEIELVLARVESQGMVESAETGVVTESEAVTDTRKVSGVEEEKKEIRQVLFDKVKQEIQTASVDQINGDIPLDLLEEVKEEIQEDLEKGFGRKLSANLDSLDPANITKINNTQEWIDNDNAVFRLFIWRDMLVELAREKPILGFDFGKPLRSTSLEIIGWGTGDWDRDGWVGAHNSYLEIIYRTGVIGIFLILSLLIVLFKMIKQFIRSRSLPGILLCAIIINWFVAANFLLTFELPYTAIPIWTIYGLTFAYYQSQMQKSISGAGQ